MVKKLQQVKMQLGVKTKWDRRVEFAGRRMGYMKREWENLGLRQGEVKVMVMQIFGEIWREGMGEKGSLELYRSCKTDRGAVCGIYDNRVGSGLLADARAGMLNTMGIKGKYMLGEDVCQVCRSQGETIEHIILECEGLGGKRSVGLGEAVGLVGYRKGEIEISKKRLSQWKAKCIE